jgi:hypothetical protein
MHYNIDYTGLGPQAAYNQQIKDIKEYLGEKKFNQITKDFRRECPKDLSLEMFKMYLSLAGISGAPVRAFHDHVFPFG